MHCAHFSPNPISTRVTFIEAQLKIGNFYLTSITANFERERYTPVTFLHVQAKQITVQSPYITTEHCDPDNLVPSNDPEATRHYSDRIPKRTSCY